MKKRLVAFLLVLTILSGVLSFAAAADDSGMQPAHDKSVSRTQFNVRAERDLDSAKLRNIGWGVKLTVVGYFDDGWCKVIYNDAGDTGYVKQSWLYITRSETPVSAPAAEGGEDAEAETEPEEETEPEAAEDEPAGEEPAVEEEAPAAEEAAPEATETAE